MIRAHVPLKTRYVDYGKVFVPNGALDFSALGASDSDVARYGPLFFNRGLLFPESSPFAAQIGDVTAALLMFEGGYLFTLTQRRREGELSAPGSARTDRPFNQARFVLLNREQIEEAFAARVSLYAGLALAARDPAASVWLSDYTAIGPPAEWSPRLERLNRDGPDPTLVRFVANAVIATAAPAQAQSGAPPRPAAPQPISVPLPGLDLIAKLQLIEAVQYWLLPRLGVITFALDYVSIQNVHLRLFELPPDAPAPLPPDRIFRPGQPSAHMTTDDFAALSALEHEALYDEALPGLLALPLDTAAAVRLHRVEKLGQAMPGDEALSLYPHLARLGERRFVFLRRVPRDDLLRLLGHEDLPAELRLDLLQVVFDDAHGLLALYAPAHLAQPRQARDAERVRALLRAALARSPDASLDLGDEAANTELLRDLLLARRVPGPPMRGKSAPGASLALATGQPVLEALLLSHRTPALAVALNEVVTADQSLFAEALAAFDTDPDVRGLYWLWRSAGQDDFSLYCALLERAVRPAWYAELARRPAVWLNLLADGRALALKSPAPEGEAGAPAGEAAGGDLAFPDEIGVLLRALPRKVTPFVWQASMATVTHDAVFAEWWLYNEALALPEQLPALWEAVERLSPAALGAAGPQLKFLLGRGQGMSLLAACTPPGYGGPSEALFAAVLRTWLDRGFRSPVGDLLLATEDVSFLIGLMPDSNDILAAVVAAPAQLPAVRGLPAHQALRWARAAAGERRGPYRKGDADILFQRLTQMDALDEALLWHILVDDEGSAAGVMPWPAYLALAARCLALADKAGIPNESRLRAYLALVEKLPGQDMADTFAQNKIDFRRLLALLSAPGGAEPPVASLLPLAVFHLQAPDGDLKDRAAVLVRACLMTADATTQLSGLPDMVLSYLRANFCQGAPELVSLGHWLDAELARRANALRVNEAGKSAAPRFRSVPSALDVKPVQTTPYAPAALPAASAAATPAPAVTSSFDEIAAAASQPPPDPEAPRPALPQLALPDNAPRKKGLDSAVLLWIILLLLVLLIVGVLIAAFVWIDSLQPAALILAWLT